MTQDPIEAAVALLLRGDRVTLTGPVVPLEVCQTIKVRFSQQNPLSDADLTAECKKVVAGYAAQLGRALNNEEKRIAYGLAGFLALKPGGEARAYVQVLISEKIWFPDRVTGPKAEKLAAEQRVKVLAMADAHAKESQRRAAAAAQESKIQADRQAMTREQRAAFVQASLARHKFQPVRT